MVIGVEVFRVLREAREAFKRINKILDDVEVISETVSRPVEGMSSLIAGIKQGSGVVKLLAKLFKEDNEDEEIREE